MVTLLASICSVYGVMSTDSEVSSPPRQPARVAVNIKKARNRGVLLRMAEPFVLSICSLAGFLYVETHVVRKLSEIKISE